MGLREEVKDSLPDADWTPNFEAKLAESMLEIVNIGESRWMFISSQDAKKWHTMAYPCMANGFVTSWNRSDFFCGNGETISASIADCKQSIENVAKTDYPVKAQVVHKASGAKGIIEEILQLSDSRRCMGKRYEVAFYAVGGALEAVAYCRQSELEKVA